MEKIIQGGQAQKEIDVDGELGDKIQIFLVPSVGFS